MNRRVERNRDIPRSAESVTRVLAAATLATYAVGLLTVNAYLNRIGIADFSQLRARFVLTGALVVLAIGAAFVPAWWGWSRRTARVGRALLLAWPAVGVAAFFAVVSGDKGALEADAGWGPNELRFALLLEAGALLAGAAAVAVAGGLHGARGAALALAGLLGAVIFVQEFGRHVYPRIPVVNGGGEAICGALVAAAEPAARLAEAGVPAGTPAPIAYEGDDFYVVALGNDGWVRVRKDLVDAVAIGDSCKPPAR